ncbi:mammaglobin-A [Cervus elaphus]|uniref:mammaglobin-A n=1 Tax=Cervus canadensis TaxID=1574408 RepID=UPI0018BC3C8B|nr:mammaglobin-A [Cervus canadensis]XP_043775530.1 mammaglobin-A [Cervus elaphus]
MKLVMVLMLAVLPLCCYAGSGCSLLENVIEKTIDPTVSKEEYRDYIQAFTQSKTEENVVDEFKQCFLQQSNETLANFEQMMQTIYNSVFCKIF